jgi:hypothetical protein
MLQEQIRRVDPSVPDLGPLQIPMGSILSDVVFDNVFSDMDMHEKSAYTACSYDRMSDVC